MINPCSSTCYWWDTNHSTWCNREPGHAGDHTDGLRWWDNYKLQTPRERERVEVQESPRWPFAATVKQVVSGADPPRQGGVVGAA